MIAAQDVALLLPNNYSTPQGVNMDMVKAHV
jgi:hypothetical protein